MDISVHGIGPRNFFGIIVPGSFFLGNLLFFLHGRKELKLTDYFVNLRNNEVWLVIIILFLLSYLFGMILRFILPDHAETLSGWILSFSPEYKKWPHIREKFPYPERTFHLINSSMDIRMKNLSSKVASFYKMPNKDVIYKYHFNYCKLFVSEHSDRLYKELINLESIVRFLNGIIISLFISLIFLFTKSYPINYDTLHLKIIILYLIILFFSLCAIKKARWKEVDSVYHAYFICNQK